MKRRSVGLPPNADTWCIKMSEFTVFDPFSKLRINAIYICYDKLLLLIPSTYLMATYVRTLYRFRQHVMKLIIIC